MKSIFIGLLLLAVVLSGCVVLEEEVVEEEEPPPPPPPPPPKVPTVSIVSPLNGEVLVVPLEGGDVTIVMQTQDLILRNPGGAKKVGQGHFRITVGEEITEVTSKIYSFSAQPGEYTVDVELLHNDGSSYSPSIIRTVSFTVESDVPPVYEPVTHTVTINDFDYEPSEITVKSGDSITFVNQGSFPRSATSNGVFNTEVIASGESATITLYELGTFDFLSTTHAAMTGTVTVESNETG
jgi:plastocyanin